MTDAVLAAQVAVSNLGAGLEAANRRTAAAELALEKAHLAIRDLEEKRFGGMACVISRYYDAAVSSVPSQLAYQIDIRPRCTAFRMIDREHLLDSRLAVAVVRENIEKVLKAHTDDLRQQLQAAAFAHIANRH